jgi:hypothetical protein
LLRDTVSHLVYPTLRAGKNSRAESAKHAEVILGLRMVTRPASARSVAMTTMLPPSPRTLSELCALCARSSSSSSGLTRPRDNHGSSCHFPVACLNAYVTA